MPNQIKERFFNEAGFLFGMHTIVNEGAIRLKISKAGKISSKMVVFYNPAMGLNRDISVLLLSSSGKSRMQIADPLAASGVRSIRFLKELNKNNIKKIYINDYNKNAIRLIKQNLALNNIKKGNFVITNKDASLFLLGSAGFDYIDIDPFGTPNPFLDAACKRISRGGILAVTATDTSVLCGTFPKACTRKYWALPKKGAVMHETGLRILIRKVQLVASQYGKALIPVFSYSKEHYMRVFFRNDKGKSIADKMLKMHGCFNDAGPMWLGNLWDKNLADKIYSNALKNKILNKNSELVKFLKIVKCESKINTAGFYDLHDICKRNKIRNLQKKDAIISKIKKSGFKASETHFSGHGIRSSIQINQLVEILRDN